MPGSSELCFCEWADVVLWEWAVNHKSGFVRSVHLSCSSRSFALFLYDGAFKTLQMNSFSIRTEEVIFLSLSIT